ncbi:MAG: magnesium/cobalt transporter CorA [Flavobacteriales bacterium]|nr:magnesium/cobalt transporter CorA [Flavobacteriales bacterium]MCB9166453.1 magnesium/cobalt transporter CorA [Flavobacteriales bacterium]
MKKVGRRSQKAGLPPGAFVTVGDHGRDLGHVHAFYYNADGMTEDRSDQLDGSAPAARAGQVGWLDFDGLENDKFVAAIAERFGLHPLLIEDVLNFDQRPKLEEYQDKLFIVVKMLSLDHVTGSVRIEQISFVLAKDLVLSFQERPGDVLDPIRDRIRNDLGRVRRSGSDYLLYALIDVIVDNYFLVVEHLGKRIEELERKISLRPGEDDLLTIQEIRSQLILLSRHALPVRELTGRLNTLQSDLIDKSTRRYLNDLQDHTLYITDSISTFRDMLANLENTWHAGVNLRMGQVMKLLTIISTIFIPLTFIVGVYGMNFRHMPELQWRYGYFLTLGVMGGLVVIMLILFKKRGWI